MTKNKVNIHKYHKLKHNIFFAGVFILFTFFNLLYAKDSVIRLDDHSKISELSSFRLVGEFDLRTQKDKNASVAFQSLNHEGGMKVRVLEILEKDELDGKTGMWLFVRTTSPMWVSSGEWINAYTDFLIFLDDETPVFDFEI